MKYINIISLVTRFHKAALVAALAMPIVYGEANAQMNPTPITMNPTPITTGDAMPDPASTIGLIYTPKPVAAPPSYTNCVINVTSCEDLTSGTLITYTYSWEYTVPAVPPGVTTTTTQSPKAATSGYPGKTCATLKTTATADLLKLPAGPTSCYPTQFSY